MNVICFHNPDEENGYMSNWYPSVFMFGSVEFSSMRFVLVMKLSLHRYLPRMTLPKSKHSVDLYWAMTIIGGMVFDRSLYMRDCWQNFPKMWLYRSN